MRKDITKVRVMSRFFVTDIIARVKNALGMRIQQYEDMLDKAKEDIWQELESENITLKWFRYEITELTNGAIVVMLYGERK